MHSRKQPHQRGFARWLIFARTESVSELLLPQELEELELEELELEEFDRLLTGHAHAAAISRYHSTVYSARTTVLHGNVTARELDAASALLAIRTGGGDSQVPAKCPAGRRTRMLREIAAPKHVTVPIHSVQPTAPPSARCPAPRTRMLRDIAAGVRKDGRSVPCVPVSMPKCLP